MLDTFQQSGRYSPMLFGATLVALVPAVGLSFIYQTLVWWFPLLACVPLLWIYLGLTCFGLYQLTRMTARLGKCRSASISVVVGLILASTTLVASHWFNYTQHRQVYSKTLADIAQAEGYLTLRSLGVDDPQIANEPVNAQYFARTYTIANHFKLSVEEGWELQISSSRYGSNNPDSGTPVFLKGPIVYILWLVEAGLILIAGSVGGINISREPYDENADRWMEPTEIYSVTCTSADSNKISSAKTLDDVITLPEKVSHSPVRVVYYMAAAETQDEPSYLKVDVEVTGKPHEEAEVTTKVMTVLRWIKLEPAQVNQLKDSITKANAAALAPPPVEKPVQESSS